jgi:hypothetical protein
LEIIVAIPTEQVIAETAELIGASENELRKRFRAAQAAGKTCQFRVKITSERWLEIKVRERAS